MTGSGPATWVGVAELVVASATTASVWARTDDAAASPTHAARTTRSIRLTAAPRAGRAGAITTRERLLLGKSEAEPKRRHVRRFGRSAAGERRCVVFPPPLPIFPGETDP